MYLYANRQEEVYALTSIVGWWQGSYRTQEYASLIALFRAHGLVETRIHILGNGDVAAAYRLTEAGYSRLAQIGGAQAEHKARDRHKFFIDNATKVLSEVNRDLLDRIQQAL